MELTRSLKAPINTARHMTHARCEASPCGIVPSHLKDTGCRTVDSPSGTPSHVVRCASHLLCFGSLRVRVATISPTCSYTQVPALPLSGEVGVAKILVLCVAFWAQEPSPTASDLLCICLSTSGLSRCRSILSAAPNTDIGVDRRNEKCKCSSGRKCGSQFVTPCTDESNHSIVAIGDTYLLLPELPSLPPAFLPFFSASEALLSLASAVPFLAALDLPPPPPPKPLTFHLNMTESVSSKSFSSSLGVGGRGLRRW